MRRLAALAGILVLGSGLATVNPQVATSANPDVDAPPGSVDVQLLAINDFHGQLTPPTGSTGGLGYLATHLGELEADNPNTLFVSGGDLIGASPLVSGLFHDEPTIEGMNLLGMDLAVVGNHEFDDGVAELYRMQDGGCHPDGCQANHVFEGADFPFLAANVVGSNGHPIFPAYKVRSFAGARVGFVGVVTKSTPMIVTRSAVAGLTFLDEVDTVNRYVAKLKATGVNTVVVLFHGSPSPTMVAAMDPVVRVVIGGHSHGTFVRRLGDVTVTMAGSTGRNITDIDLTIDRSTGLATDVAARNVSVTRDVPPDDSASELVADYLALAAPLANRVVGSITADISGLPLGTLIADAQLEATSSASTGGAVVAFMNPGGVRDGLSYGQVSGGELPGEVTYGEVFSVQPFANMVVTKTMTGAMIEAVIKQGNLYDSTSLTYVRTPGPSGWEISELMINGVPILPEVSYRVTMNSFLADGGDGFTVFTQGTEPLVGAADLDALVAYFGAHSPVAPAW
jgi:5'-nucleotidase